MRGCIFPFGGNRLVGEADFSVLDDRYVTLNTVQTIGGTKTLDQAEWGFAAGSSLSFAPPGGDGTDAVAITGSTVGGNVGIRIGNTSYGTYLFLNMDDDTVEVYAEIVSDSPASLRRNVEHVTATGSETFRPDGAVVTNKGATGAIVRTLPDAVAGRTFTYARVANHQMGVFAASGDEINFAGDVRDPGAAPPEGIALNSNGATATLVAIDNTTWVVTSTTGTVAALTL